MIKKVFNTPLGKIICQIDSPVPIDLSIINKEYKNGTSEIFNIGGYHIEFVEFKLKQPLYNGGTVTDTQAWIWRIEKLKESSETLNLSCKLNNLIEGTEYDVASGEHLDAIEAYNKKHRLHIGTEDGEIMNFRAQKNDSFPIRLEDMVGFSKSITKRKVNGFETKIPNLKTGEKIHVQFLVAYDSEKTDTFNANTWLAVESPKDELEKWIGLS